MKKQTSRINTAYISVGSNMGDSLANCKNALADLDKTHTVSVDAISRFYFTEPMEYSDQPWFVNAAARIITSLTPGELLVSLKSFETAYGRTVGGVRFGPRPLDFDIIFYNELIIDTPELVVPHPRMHYREFVLRPIRDLAPDLIHPVLCKSIQQLLDAMMPQHQQCIPVLETAN